MKCLEQHGGPVIKFKSRFRTQRFDIKTEKDRLGQLGTLIINAVIPPIVYIFMCPANW